MNVTLDLIWFVLLLVIFILNNYSTQTEALHHISIQTIYEESKPAFFADQMGKKWKDSFCWSNLILETDMSVSLTNWMNQSRFELLLDNNISKMQNMIFTEN